MTRHEHKFTADVLALALTPVGSADGFGAPRYVLSPLSNSITNQQATSAAARPAVRLRREGTT
jgi:hypothetical protein